MATGANWQSRCAFALQERGPVRSTGYRYGVATTLQI